MALKMAMHNWMRAEPIETTITRLGRSGYDGIEISGEPATYDARADQAASSNDNGLECWGSVTLMTGGRDLVTRTITCGSRACSTSRTASRSSASSGGDILTVVPSHGRQGVPMASPEEEWAGASRA